jgi:hypothetical protein
MYTVTHHINNNHNNNLTINMQLYIHTHTHTHTHTTVNGIRLSPLFGKGCVLPVLRARRGAARAHARVIRRRLRAAFAHYRRYSGEIGCE